MVRPLPSVWPASTSTMMADARLAVLRTHTGCVHVLMLCASAYKQAIQHEKMNIIYYYKFLIRTRDANVQYV